MVYTKKTKLAMRIAFEAHKDQMDKCGVPYVFHPIHLAEQMTDETTTCVALLHDVVEDTPITFTELEEYGFDAAVIEALKLLTHDEDVPYMDYVVALKHNKVAKAVKLADLRHNSDMTRLDEIDDYAIKRAEKYKAAIKLLEE